jgi:GT2 family glycosyltransferase
MTQGNAAPLSGKTPRVSIVTPIFNGIADTVAYLASLEAVHYPNFEVIIVDDGSSDGSSQIIADAFPAVRVLRGDGNLWWSGSTNFGIEDALSRGTDFVLTMNNDVKVAPDFLDALVVCAQENPDAIVGGKIYFMAEPDRIWSAGGVLRWASGKTFGMRGHGERDSEAYRHRREVDFFTGMCVLIPAPVFSRIGHFDAAHFPQYHGDSEFTLRARKAGIRLVFEPQAKVWNRVESTFMQRFAQQPCFGPGQAWELLNSFRSPMNLRQYWALHRDYCPPALIPLAFGLRLVRVALFLMKVKWAHLKGGKTLDRIGT